MLRHSLSTLRILVRNSWDYAILMPADCMFVLSAGSFLVRKGATLRFAALSAASLVEEGCVHGRRVFARSGMVRGGGGAEAPARHSGKFVPVVYA